MNPVDTIFVLVAFVLSITGAVTILYHFMEWVFADKLYDITEQELRDSRGSTWITYTKYYKLLGVKFTRKVGPFKNYNTELKCKIEELRAEQEEAKLKASLKPVIKL
jgi:hypothetical protein